MEEELGTIRVSPQVIAAIVALSAASVPGVAWLNSCSRQERPLRAPEEMARAARVSVRQEAVQADIYLTLERGAGMMEVARKVQREISEAIRRMLGLDVEAINVFIVDVAG